MIGRLVIHHSSCFEWCNSPPSLHWRVLSCGHQNPGSIAWIILSYPHTGPGVRTLLWYHRKRGECVFVWERERKRGRGRSRNNFVLLVQRCCGCKTTPSPWSPKPPYRYVHCGSSMHSKYPEPWLSGDLVQFRTFCFIRFIRFCWSC